VPAAMTGGLEVGIEEQDEFEVAGHLLTDVEGALGAPVLSTPAMIGMMERTAHRLVRPRLADGQATVGFEVCIRHVAAAPSGSRCKVRARLEEVREGRKLRFAVEVADGSGRTIGVGTHERRVIEVGGRR
jgi:fluoroacetyl-CoA thioesterase